MDSVLVLNADLGPLHRVSLRHAVRMLFREVAVVHEAEPDIRIGIFPVPKVVRLVHYVVTRWRFDAGPAWSRNGVIVRDRRRCAYCGGPATTVTTSPRGRVAAATPGSTRWPPVAAATSARATGRRPKRGWRCG